MSSNINAEELKALIRKNTTSTIESFDDHVYYNVNIQNPADSPYFFPASFSETRTDPIIDVPENYHASIIRMLIPTQLIPIFKFESKNDPADNTGIYSVTLSYDDGKTTTNVQEFLEFIPSEYNTTPTNTDTYFRVFNYQPMVNMTNIALKNAFDTLLTTVGTGVFAPTRPPFISFDKNREAFNLNAQTTYDPIVAGTGTVVPTVSIWMNMPLFSFFDGLYAPFNRNGNLDPDGKAFNIIVTNDGSNNEEVVTPPNNVGYTGSGQSFTGYVMRQELPSLSNWNEFKSIVVTTESLPLKRELVQGIVSTGQTDSVGSNQLRPIFTDFVLNPEATSNFRQDLVYLPTAEYRLVDMQGVQPLRKFDVTVWFQGEDQSLTPVYITPGSLCTMKIMFRKKSEIK